MLDFRELPEDGQAFEQLVREILFSQGLHVQWSGVGPDGGRDLICHETTMGAFVTSTQTWLVQCKHFAHAGRSAGVNDLDDIATSCAQHNATGYLLACSTQPSSAVVNRLEGVSANPNSSVTATYWDGVTIERLLSTPRQWSIAQRFFPASAGAWRIYATERPNDFIAHFKGYVFHLSNRIGSKVEHRMPVIENRIAEVQAIPMKEGHFIRFRSFWYDDKSGTCTGYIDYMYPLKQKPSYSPAEIAELLHEGDADDDGPAFFWDVRTVEYWAESDHYDKDHYDHYVEFMPNFLEGTSRSQASASYYATKQEVELLEQKVRAQRHIAFEAMAASFQKLPFIRLVNAINAAPEDIHRFERRYAWSNLARELGTSMCHFFDAALVLEISDESAFHALLARLPIDSRRRFRVARVYEYRPDGLRETKNPIYDLRLFIFPPDMDNQHSARKAFDGYFDAIRQAVEEVLAGAQP